MAFKTRESLDTNVILRLVLRDVPEQCLKIQDLLMRMYIRYDVADLAITEAVYVLQKQYTRAEIVEHLERVLDLPNINANFALWKRVFPAFLEHPQLSFNDCCLAAYAELNESEPLWTFDKKLAVESGTAKLVG